MHNKTDSVRLNVTLKCIHITIVAIEKQLSSTYLECVCSLSYPACKAHVLCYIVICALSFSTVFPMLSHNWHNFQEKVIRHKMGVLIFSTTFV